MKNTNTCPKCNSKEIVRLADQTDSTLVPTNFTIFGAVYMTRYLCADCGFTEEWVEKPSDRETLRGRHKPQ